MEDVYRNHKKNMQHMYKLKTFKNISFIYMSIYLNISGIKYKKLHFFFFPKKRGALFGGLGQLLKAVQRITIIRK